ncbi:MAG TPA: DegT/DnrJ/EryC1/StrS family aminotransferase [Bryobacteraceae bacterium]|nr:DegT/DnrJ/EryC1/StrS family aminotransferase [Bryobacteraceae bacterium]
MNSQPFIPFHTASVGDEEVQEVTQVLRSGWLTTGARTAQFENEFRTYVGAAHALGVNSCTAGLHLALAGLGIGPGDQVITTPLTFCATVNTILHVGAEPVLADIDKFGNIDPELIAAKITAKTRAIMPVHYSGAACRMREIWKLAREHGLFVIEDAAHAIGTHYEGRQIGSSAAEPDGCSDAVAYSFYATKSLTTGEGGMVVTPSEALYNRMKVLCLHGISRDAWNRYTSPGKWYYEVVDCGFKYNLPDIQSAIGLHQLRKQEAFIARRTEIARLYTRLLADLPEITTPSEPMYGRHAWHLYPIQLGGCLDGRRAAFIDGLTAGGIGSSVHFIPITAHPYYAQFAWADPAGCPRATELWQRMVSLPIYPNLTDDDVHRIARTIRRLVSDARKAVVSAHVSGQGERTPATVVGA